MANHSTVPVRLDETQLANVRLHAQRFGIPDSMFIRWAIDALVKYIEHHDGNLPLPIDFSQHWKSAMQLAEEAIRAGKFPAAPVPAPALAPTPKASKSRPA